MSASLPSAAAPFIGVGSALRFHEVSDDLCAPDVNKRDFVLIAPVSDYSREGYYLVADWCGTPCVYMCVPAGAKDDRRIRLHKSNPLYCGEDEVIRYAELRERVLGKIVMTCKMRDPSLLPQLA